MTPLIIILFLMCSPIFALDNFTPTQNVLDQNQFEKEKKAKERSAAKIKPDNYRGIREETLNCALNTLPIEKIEHGIPRDLQEYIGSFIPASNKLPIYCTKSHIAAVIPWKKDQSVDTCSFDEIVQTATTYKTLFAFTDEIEQELHDFARKHQAPAIKNTKPHIIGQKYVAITHSQPIWPFCKKPIMPYVRKYNAVSKPDHKKKRICLRNAIHDTIDCDVSTSGFTAHIYNDGTILYALNHPEHRKDLARLSLHHKNYLDQLREAHEQALKKKEHIVLTNEQLNMHFSLPSHIQDNLEKNYNLPQINSKRRKIYLKKCKQYGIPCLVLMLAASHIFFTGGTD